MIGLSWMWKRISPVELGVRHVPGRAIWLQHTCQVISLHTKDAELSCGWNAFLWCMPSPTARRITPNLHLSGYISSPRTPNLSGSYNHIHLWQDTRLPLNKMTKSIPNTPIAPDAFGLTNFPHFIMVMRWLCAPLWVVCQDRSPMFM